jgi:hypothetical protein
MSRLQEMRIQCNALLGKTEGDGYAICTRVCALSNAAENYQEARGACPLDDSDFRPKDFIDNKTGETVYQCSASVTAYPNPRTFRKNK